MTSNRLGVPSNFAKIYLGLLSALIIIFYALYSSYQLLNNHRYHNFVARSIIGPARLITLGWESSRPTPHTWIEKLNQLSSVNWSIVNETPDTISPHSQSNKLYLTTDRSRNTAEVWWQIDNSIFAHTKIDHFQESLPKLISALVSVHLTDSPTSLSHKNLQQLGNILGYPIYKRKDELPDPASFDGITLASGLPILIEEQGKTTNKTYQILLPTKQPDNFLNTSEQTERHDQPTNEIINVGPIPTFIWATYTTILIYITIAIILIGTAIFLLLFPLQSRLVKIIKAIDEIEDVPESIKVPTEGNDELSEMAHKINNVALKLVDALKKNRELNQSVSHELKTPISRIRFRVEALNNENANKLEIKKSIIRDLCQLEALVTELLYFHQIGEKPGNNSVSFNLFPVVCDVVEEAEESYKDISYCIEVETNFKMHGRLPEVRRLIKNLVENASNYGKNIVRIAASTYKNKTIIVIEDNGNGIPESQRERILLPFARLDESRNKNTGGTGLGLAICKRIAESHSGRLLVESSQQGGCCIRIELPAHGYSAEMTINELPVKKNHGIVTEA